MKRSLLSSMPLPFRFLACVFLSGSTFAADGSPANSPAAERPNLLFIFADDWGRYASLYRHTLAAGSPSGLNEIVRTPHFDEVARQGVLFRNAHVNAPSCTPSRSSLLSGQYFWRTGRGAILQGAVWDARIPSYPLLLRDAGYHIGKTYKVWSPGTPGDAPFEGGRHAYETEGRRFNRFSQNVTRLAAEGTPLEQAKRELCDEVRRNFRRFLADRKTGQPFHYWFGPTNTHRPWVQGSGKDLWGIDPDALQGKLPPFLPDVPEIREDLADYLGEISALDAAIGALLEELQQAGASENTLIVISGDHGAPGFPHGKCNLYTFGTGVALSITGPGVQGGRVVDDFVSLTDLAPTFLEAAGLPIPEAVTGRSLWPVLRSAASGQVDPERTWVLTGRERHVADARSGFLPYPQRAIHTRTHLYLVNFQPDRFPLGDPIRLEEAASAPSYRQLREDTHATFSDMDAGPTKAWLVSRRDDPRWKPYFDRAFGKRPREELYDLSRDPHQIHNLADDPSYAGIKADLSARLFAELERTGDPRVANDGSYYEQPPLSGPLR